MVPRETLCQFWKPSPMRVALFQRNLMNRRRAGLNDRPQVLGITAASSVPQAAALRRCVAAATGGEGVGSGGGDAERRVQRLRSPAAVTEPLFALAVDRLRAMAFVGLQEEHAAMTRDFAASRGISLQSLSHSLPPPPTPVEAQPEFEVIARCRQLPAPPRPSFPLKPLFANSVSLCLR